MTNFSRGDENFVRQSLNWQDNHNLSKRLVTLWGSLVLQLKTLLLLLGKTFRRAKVTNFSFSDENFARQIVSPDKVTPDKVESSVGRSGHIAYFHSTCFLRFVRCAYFFIFIFRFRPKLTNTFPLTDPFFYQVNFQTHKILFLKHLYVIMLSKSVKLSFQK